eukprot:TRINITY_DN2589_c0_g1_i6.p1 TRINITY_DN2589_c0_g1~~TRINITY_DN2589_c0_g1_i6.p1  ORF type:complete len:362 (+),score=32.86 TRINITY_DN2589_c0_g1_i6:854-1939(+)
MRPPRPVVSSVVSFDALGLRRRHAVDLLIIATTPSPPLLSVRSPRCAESVVFDLRGARRELWLLPFQDTGAIGCKVSSLYVVQSPRGTHKHSRYGTELSSSVPDSDCLYDCTTRPHYDLDAWVNRNRDPQGMPIDPTLPDQEVTTYKVLLTGLENSGKSQLLYTLLTGPEPAEEPCQTEGYHEETMYVAPGDELSPQVNFHVFDLGGQLRVRERFLGTAMRGCRAIVFTVAGASSAAELVEARAWLRELLDCELSYHEKQPVPILFLVTMCDLPDAVPPELIADAVLYPNLVGRDADRLYSIAGISIYNPEEHLQAAIGFACLARQIESVPMTKLQSFDNVSEEPLTCTPRSQGSSLEHAP